MRERLPKLEFTGQTTDELLACKDTHTPLSIVYAFQWGIQAKARKVGEQRLTEEERTVLAVLALQREVNNGGYFQFFWNSSRSYAPSIVTALNRIGDNDAAKLTETAIAALGLPNVTVEAVSQAISKEDPVRDAVLSSCDTEFYKLTDGFPRLFRFILENAARIQLERTDDYPRFPKRSELSVAAKLQTRLMFWKKGWRPTLEEAGEAAVEIAKRENIPATVSDAEKGAMFYVFELAMRDENFTLCDSLAPTVFERMKGEIGHTLARKQWVQLLLKHGRAADADMWALSYLQHIRSAAPPDDAGQKRLEFWAAVLQENRDALPNSFAYFEATYPQVDLSNPVRRTIIYNTKRVPGTGPLANATTDNE